MVDFMEDTYKKKPLWTAINGVPNMYPWLSYNETCSVCIVGGGVTGALCALRFARQGIDTVLLSAGPVGYGGTSESSGVLQLNIGGGLDPLSKQIGTKQAVTVYEHCLKAMDQLEELVSSLDDQTGFYRTDTLTFTKEEDNIDEIHKEYLLLKHNNFEVGLIDREKAAQKFSFELEAGMVAKRLGAIVDPYRLTHALLKAAQNAGARVYENTPVNNIQTVDGKTTIDVDTRHTVTTDTVIAAVGIDCINFIKSSGSKRTTFAIATGIDEDLADFGDKFIINDIDHPEITYSVTPGDRIISYGLEAGMIDRKRKVASFFPLTIFEKKKYRHLEKELQFLFPGLRQTKAEFAFTADHFQTDDCLPLIGSHHEYENCYFAFCTGRSGILFSEIASEMILAEYQGKQHALSELFSPDRF